MSISALPNKPGIDYYCSTLKTGANSHNKVITKRKQ